MLLYILKSGVCLALLYVFYKAFLEKENMHTFKRFYLLGALLTAFIIPFITFVQYVEIPTTSQVIEQSNPIFPIISNSESHLYPTDYLLLMLWSIYVIGVLSFGFRFIKNIFGIILRIRKNPKHRINQLTNVLLLDNIIPHTFFNYIFLNKQKFEAKQIPKEVLLHEETHALQKHSLDVLFIEFLQILFWFNPLIYFTKKAIKLNHEFLADKAVLNEGVKPTLYQQILLEFSSNSTEPPLANAINYSSIKKRFTVMKTKTSKKSIVFRSLLLLPLLALLLYGFSDKIVVPLYEEPATEETFVDFQEGATTEQIEEYNVLARKYNRQISNDKAIQIFKSDVERLEYLHGLMNEEQRANAEPFPDFPEPPPAPKAPDAPNPVQKIINEQEIYDELGRPASLSAIKPNKTFEAISAPKPPIVKKGEVSNIPPPPPSAPKGIQGERSTIAPNALVVHVGEVSDIPPPLPPKSPIDHVVEMAKKDAIFYFEGKEISSEQAIAILKKNKKINIRTKHKGLKKPIVELSTKPFIIKK